MSPSIIGNTHSLFLASEAHIINSKNAEGNGLSNTLKSKNKNIRTTDYGENRTNDWNIQIVWRNVVIFIILHTLALYSIGLVLFGFYNWKTLLFTYIYTVFSGFGITAGAHRLWAHRTYKANLPLRIFLMLAQSAALQNDIHEWSRDHRVHHKFTDTNADPHNASRGFFFSHIGWLMCKKHKDVFEKGKTVDMSDVLGDPVVQFQIKYYILLIIIMTLCIPTFIPWYFFGETLWMSFVICMGRYVVSLNGTWLVNSAAHIWGNKPYERDIKPTENKSVSIIAFGEGWHNYHHIFPWDYKAAELGNYRLNFTTAFLDLMEKIGWATELKTASKSMIRRRATRTGDGSWSVTEKIEETNMINAKDNHHLDSIWGWGDKDMKQTEANEIRKFNRIRA
ncbi:stearoyl-CoA desaturase 5-like [Sitophilus oryzae]|uniref:Stearoyl-CoA desaturase 5-like n=1 Tax=Sitophilus oryzae TaxID=7048 RepID=A0A6J2YWE3_SITOR|nr:stearoyl-CoA desaturase 5-like [Sitophilus oryzae]XP_030767580.1 stearoyl-CoA desaturase 5-like [Sitophilus oryzae]